MLLEYAHSVHVGLEALELQEAACRHVLGDAAHLGLRGVAARGVESRAIEGGGAQ